jgi:hypothetical protein
MAAGRVRPGPAQRRGRRGRRDGDGWPDAVTGSTQIGRRDVLYLGARGGVRRLAVAAAPPRGLIGDVALADVDADGRDDVVWAVLARDGAGWSGRVEIVAGAPRAGAAARAIVVEPGRTGFTALATGDLDRDGARDVVAISGQGAVLAFRGDGRGAFVRAAELPSPFHGCTGRHVALADVSGDGVDDIVASYADEAAACAGGGGIAVWRRG